jgi:hypothetical protein
VTAPLKKATITFFPFYQLLPTLYQQHDPPLGASFFSSVSIDEQQQHDDELAVFSFFFLSPFPNIFAKNPFF